MKYSTVPLRNGLPWPKLEYELVTIAGQNNTIGMPIYLLPIDTARGLLVDETRGGKLTLDELPGFELNIMPGSATFPDGGKRGTVSVTLVHADKVPMVPNFGQQPRFIITIQPPGTHFNPLAALTMPNVDGLAPGQKTEMYSFDHDLGAFVSIGPATVSEDGTVVKSDPGVGVVKGGWHCGGNPSTTGNCGDCPACQRLEGNQCVPDATCQDDGTCQQPCRDCEVCRQGVCVPDLRCSPPEVPCESCPTQFACATCENNACVFAGCGDGEGDGTCTQTCGTCTRCSNGQCVPNDTCEDDGTCTQTCASCSVCRNGQCVPDARCDLGGGNPGDSCDAIAPCKTCLKCEGGVCVADDSQILPQNTPDDCRQELCRNGVVVSQPNDLEQPSLIRDIIGDCNKPACRSGSATQIADLFDVPLPFDDVKKGDCRIPGCIQNGDVGEIDNDLVPDDNDFPRDSLGTPALCQSCSNGKLMNTTVCTQCKSDNICDGTGQCLTPFNISSLCNRTQITYVRDLSSPVTCQTEFPGKDYCGIAVEYDVTGVTTDCPNIPGGVQVIVSENVVTDGGCNFGISDPVIIGPPCTFPGPACSDVYSICLPRGNSLLLRMPSGSCTETFTQTFTVSPGNCKVVQKIEFNLTRTGTTDCHGTARILK